MVAKCYCCGDTREFSHVETIMMSTMGWIRYPNMSLITGENVFTCPSCSQKMNDKMMKFLNEVKKECVQKLIVDGEIISEEVIEEHVLSEV